jgi:hypothetical protein
VSHSRNAAASTVYMMCNNDFEKGLRAVSISTWANQVHRRARAAIIAANETDMIPPTTDSRLFALFCKGSLCFFGVPGVALTGATRMHAAKNIF